MQYVIMCVCNIILNKQEIYNQSIPIGVFPGFSSDMKYGNLISRSSNRFEKRKALVSA